MVKTTEVIRKHFNIIKDFNTNEEDRGEKGRHRSLEARVSSDIAVTAMVSDCESGLEYVFKVVVVTDVHQFSRVIMLVEQPVKTRLTTLSMDVAAVRRKRIDDFCNRIAKSCKAMHTANERHNRVLKLDGQSPYRGWREIDDDGAVGLWGTTSLEKSRYV